MSRSHTVLSILDRLSKRRRSLLLAGVSLLACVVMLYELGDSKTLGSHEVFTAVPVREMLRAGDWIVPRYGGMPRLEKPPLGYWVSAASASLFGEVSAWSVRLPSAVSALLLSALIGIWAGRWYSPEAGLAAGLIQATSMWTMIYGRKAEVDILLCLLITAAMFLVAEQRPDEDRRVSFARWTGIYFLLSLAWLGKFHFGVVIVLGPAVAYFCIQKRYRELVRLLNPVGLLLLSAAIAVWPYLVVQQVPDALSVWLGETVGRATGELGREPIWFYFPHMVSFLVPWLPLTVYAVPASLRQAVKQADARERFLWVWFIVQLVIICGSANKHRNYVLPILPACSLFAAQAASALLHRVKRGELAIRFRTAVIVSIVGVAGMLPVWITCTRKWPHLTVSLAVVAISISGSICATVWLFERRCLRASGLSAVGGFLLCYIGITGWIIPGSDHRVAAARFGLDIRKELSSDQEVCVYRMVKAHGGKHPIVYYLDDPVARIESRELLRKRLARDKQVYVVTYEPTVEELADVGRLQTVKRMVTPRGRAPYRGPPLVLIALSDLGGAVKQESVRRDALSSARSEAEAVRH